MFAPLSLLRSIGALRDENRTHFPIIPLLSNTAITTPLTSLLTTCRIDKDGLCLERTRVVQ